MKSAKYFNNTSLQTLPMITEMCVVFLSIYLWLHGGIKVNQSWLKNELQIAVDVFAIKMSFKYSYCRAIQGGSVIRIVYYFPWWQILNVHPLNCWTKCYWSSYFKQPQWPWMARMSDTRVTSDTIVMSMPRLCTHSKENHSLTLWYIYIYIYIYHIKFLFTICRHFEEGYVAFYASYFI